ncbi:MAG: YcxB domain-containing protein [Lachnoclostridium sp.]|jgi:hypothetical protein
MKTKLFSRLFALAILLAVIFPPFHVQAKEVEFPEISIKLTIPEQTVVLTSHTPNTDENWKVAGITDPKSEKKTMNNMGVVAILYDKNSNSTVRLMEKYSGTTRKIFHLSLLSEKELDEFLESFTSDTDRNEKATIEKYSHPEIPFYRYTLKVEQEGDTYQEIIYGTIVNGCAVNFDTYAKNNKEPIDESFIKELVAGSHFTEFLDKAEVEKQERSFRIRVIIFLIVSAGLITAAVFYNRKKRRKLNEAKAAKADALSKFYTEQKKKEEQNIKDPVLFVNRTRYTEEVIKDYFYYNEIFHKLKTWIIVAVCFLLILVMLYQTKYSFISCSIAVILLFAFVYYQGIRIEKLIKQTMNVYHKNKNTEAVFTFYEDYFTLSGIQYLSKYPYLQITEIREYKDYIYLYNGPDKAFYMKKDGFDKDVNDFIKFIKETVKSKKTH